ncbi:MAG: hypothetical protein WDO24_14835 [Pseudomonadota bacterium]
MASNRQVADRAERQQACEQTGDEECPYEVGADQEDAERQADQQTQRQGHMAEPAQTFERLEAHELIDRPADVAQLEPDEIERREAEEQREVGGLFDRVLRLRPGDREAQSRGGEDQNAVAEQDRRGLLRDRVAPETVGKMAGFGG